MYRVVTLAALLLMSSAGSASAQDRPRLDPQVLQAVRAACSADVQRLCPGIQPGGGRILQCMRSRQSELSADCQSALATAAAQR